MGRQRRPERAGPTSRMRAGRASAGFRRPRRDSGSVLAPCARPEPTPRVHGKVGRSPIRRSLRCRVPRLGGVGCADGDVGARPDRRRPQMVGSAHPRRWRVRVASRRTRRAGQRSAGVETCVVGDARSCPDRAGSPARWRGSSPLATRTGGRGSYFLPARESPVSHFLQPAAPCSRRGRGARSVGRVLTASAVGGTG